MEITDLEKDILRKTVTYCRRFNLDTEYVSVCRVTSIPGLLGSSIGYRPRAPGPEPLNEVTVKVTILVGKSIKQPQRDK